MASISMADFRPHLPSDDPDTALGSQTLLGEAAQGLPQVPQPVSAPGSDPGRSEGGPPGPPADPNAEARRAAAQAKLLRQVLTIAIVLELLGGRPSAPLSRRRRRRGGGRLA